MAQSEITYGLIKLDLFDYGELFSLTPNHKLLFVHCLLQGIKNNLGIFQMHRGKLSLWLGIPIEDVHAFFEKHKNLVEFNEETHTIWVKPFFDLVEFGLNKPLHKQIKHKKTGEHLQIIDLNSRNNKNNFVSKVNARFREEHALQIFLKKWVQHNFILLSKVNEELKNIEGNKHSLDKLLQSY